MAKKILYILCIIALLSIASCTKLNLDDMGDVNYSPSLVFPVGKIHAGLDQLISSVDSTYIGVDDETKTFYLSWKSEKDTVVTIDIHDYAQGAEHNLDFSIASSEGGKNIFDQLPPYVTEIDLPADDYHFTLESTYPFDYNESIPGEKDYRIDSCHIYSATLDLTVDASDLEISEVNYLDVALRFPTIVIDGEALVLTDRMTSSHGRLMEVYNDFPVAFLEGYERNEVPMVATFTYHSDGTATLSRNARLKFMTYFHLSGFNKLYGYFYNAEPLTSDKIETDVPSNSLLDMLLVDNKLLVHDPQVIFNLYSNSGIPMTIEIANVRTEDKNGNSVSANFESSAEKRIDVVMPAIGTDGKVEPATTTVVLNRENAETNKLLTILPSKFFYEWAVYASDADRAYYPHLITETPNVMADVEVKLPLVFDAGTHFNYDTVIDADLTGIIPTDTIDIKALSLNFAIQNAIPLAIDLKLDFLDDNDNVIFSGEETKIEAAVVDEQGRSTAPSNQTLVVNCKEETIDKILSTKRIGFNTTISGRDAQSGIYLQTTDSLSVGISAFLKLGATININSALGK